MQSALRGIIMIETLVVPTNLNYIKRYDEPWELPLPLIVLNIVWVVSLLEHKKYKILFVYGCIVLGSDFL